MAWVESHQDLRDHPKTAKLRRRLGVNLATAIGHLHLLWWWSLSYADDGRLGEHDDDVIAEAGGWEGDAAAFVEALVAAGFLDHDRTIHDWDDYTGRLQERREANRIRQQKWRERNALPTSPPQQEISTNELVTRDVSVTNALNQPTNQPTGNQPTGNQPTNRLTNPPPKPSPPPSGEGLALAAASDTKTGSRNGTKATEEKPVLNGRNGRFGCPAGCPTNHGGPLAARYLGEDWLAVPTDRRPPWPEYLRQHGRPDLTTEPAPMPAAQEA